MPLEWGQIDFGAGEIRLDPGTAKNGEGLVFPMTQDLRRLLKGHEAERQRVQKLGRVVPWVFFRMVGKRGGRAPEEPRRITAFTRRGRLPA